MLRTRQQNLLPLGSAGGPESIVQNPDTNKGLTRLSERSKVHFRFSHPQGVLEIHMTKGNQTGNAAPRKIKIDGPQPWRPFSFESAMRDPDFLVLGLDAQGLCFRIYGVRYQGEKIFSDPCQLAKQTGANPKTIRRLLPELEGFFLAKGDWLVPRREMPGVYGEDPKLPPIEPVQDREKMQVQPDIDQEPIKVDQESSTDDSAIVVSNSNNSNTTSGRVRSTHNKDDGEPKTLEGILGGPNSPLLQAHRELSAIFSGRAANQTGAARALVKAVGNGTSAESILQAAKAYRDSHMKPIRKKDDTQYMMALNNWLEGEGFRQVITLAPVATNESNRVTIQSEAFDRELDDLFPTRTAGCDDDPS